MWTLKVTDGLSGHWELTVATANVHVYILEVWDCVYAKGNEHYGRAYVRSVSVIVVVRAFESNHWSDDQN